jgi:hypothetical protein
MIQERERRKKDLMIIMVGKNRAALEESPAQNPITASAIQRLAEIPHAALLVLQRP